MIDKFWESFAGKLADQWSARVLSPALIFWAGGLTVWLVSRPAGWHMAVEQGGQTLRTIPVAAQIGGIIAALAMIAGSAALAERLTPYILRVLEGYWPRFLSDLVLRGRRTRLARARQRAVELATARVPASGASDTSGASGASGASGELARLEAFLHRYPDPALMLPTRLGNALRLAESRPRERYGLDAVVCWPYLWLVLDDTTRNELTQARAALNGAARTWLWSVAFAVWTIWVWWVAPIALIAATATYYVAGLSTASTYGIMVEAAFALHRHKLYQALRWPLPDQPHQEQQQGEELTVYLWRGIAPEDIRFSDGATP